MGYVYDASTRSYRSSSTSGTKAASAVTRTKALVFSKLGSQVAPAKSFYQSPTRVSISTQAQKLASGVRTSVDTILNTSDPTKLPSATAYLERTIYENAKPVSVVGFDVFKKMTSDELAAFKAAAQTAGAIMSLRLPPGASSTIDSATAKSLGADILNKLDGSFTLELAPADLSDATFLQSLKTTLGRKISNLRFSDNSTSAEIRSADVKDLGPDIWSKFGGSINVVDTESNITTKENWDQLRILNNYRAFKLSVSNDGIPSGTPASKSLSEFDLSLDYGSFTSGYSLIKNLTRQTLDFGSTSVENTSVRQSFQVSGKILSRDRYDVELTKANGTKVTLALSPLAIAPSASAEDRVNALAAAIQDALKKNSAFSKVVVSSENNKISLDSTNSVFSGSLAIRQAERGEDAKTNFFDVTDAPIYALSALSSVPELRSISVTTKIDGLRSNWDSLTRFNATTPLANINIPGTGDLSFTARETEKYLPIIEKISGRQFFISDAPYALSTYANFTEAAAGKLATSVDLTGSVAEFMKGSAGIAALSKAGKLRSITLTDAGASIISLDSKTATSLVNSLGSLSQTAKIQITDKPSLTDAAIIANSQLATRLTGSFIIQTDGTDITPTNLDALGRIDSRLIASISVVEPLNLEKTLMLTGRPYTISPRIQVHDNATNMASGVQTKQANGGFTSREINSIATVSILGDDPNDEIMTLANANLVNRSGISELLISGIKVKDTPANLSAGLINLVKLKDDGRLRSITVDGAMNAALQTDLQQNELISFVV